MHAQPNWSRLSIVPVTPEQALIMDRGNGRWAYVPADDVPLVQLLNIQDHRLPDPVRERRDALASELHEIGLGGREYGTPPDLNTVILKLTKACNYVCSYCYDLEPEDKIEHLPLETAVQVMEEALELTPHGVGIILHGGEPTLLFSLLKQIVLEGEALARRMVKRITFIGQTNLSKLNREMVDFFQEHQVQWGISLDGPPDLNDRFRVLRNGAGTYRYFERALEQFPDFVRSCGILTTVTSHNDSQLLRIARHFRDVGMRSWNWSLFQPIGMGRQQANLFSFSIDRLLDAWNELFDAVEEGEFDGMRIAPVTAYLENFLSGPGQNMCMKKDCGAGRDLLSVSADGTIQACDCIDPKGPYANLGLVQIGGHRSLEKARSHERAELIRSRDITVGQCRDCVWLAVCGGTCMAHAHELNGVWGDQCQIAMLAFSRIATSLAESDALRRYWDSLRPLTDPAS
jgi:uncharacterized protein